MVTRPAVTVNHAGSLMECIMPKFTIDSLTPKQRKIFDAMPIGQWVEPGGNVMLSAIQRMGFIELDHVYVGKPYGRILQRRYRRNA